MPDISMCHGGLCQKKHTCYRFTATPNPHRQSYLAEPPYERYGFCDKYLQIEDKNERGNVDDRLQQDTPAGVQRDSNVNEPAGNHEPPRLRDVPVPVTAGSSLPSKPKTIRRRPK